MNLDPEHILSAPLESPHSDDDGDFAGALVAGLRRVPKRVPCKYLYDAAGSALFERICELPEYYQTRTELGLLQRHAHEIARHIGDDAELVEFGAGAGVKVRVLLDALVRPRAYLPIDISGQHLRDAAGRLAADYAGLAIGPVVADYTRPFRLPAPAAGARRRVGFFPGSTIGNFAPDEAVSFLLMASRLLKGGGLLVGADLVKDPALLHAAYNDADGVTAAFNRNVLARANRELDANFDLERFAHYAFYHPLAQRIEMHLVSLATQRVRAAGEEFAFVAGEALHTEDSYKYTVDGFRALAVRGGFVPAAVWVDPAQRFSLYWLESR